MKKNSMEQARSGNEFNLDTATSATDEQIASVMNYHPWCEEQIASGNKVRSALGEALKVILNVVPPSLDRTVAIRKLREARLDCNSAITFNGKL